MDDPTPDIERLERLFEDFRVRGDVKALAAVFDAAAPELYAIARFLARREGEAEDLVQQTFLVAIERAASFDAKKSLMPWMLGILTMKARKRSDRRERDRDDADADATALEGREDPVREAESHELHDAVAHAVAALPEKYGRILTLHLAEDRSPSEIASVLALEPGTARVQLHRALKMLRESLPIGFAGGIGGIVAPERALDGVRANVLNSAKQFVPQVSTATAGSATMGASTKWMVGAAAAILISIGVWLVVPILSSTDKAALALEPGTHKVDPTLGAGDDLASDTSATRTSLSAPIPAATGGLDAVAMGETAHILGRLLRPDGTAAAGATSVLKGWAGNELLTREYGAPTDWKNPEPVVVDPDGRFQWTVTPPRSFSFILEAELDGCARLSWMWPEISGKQIDLGDVQFEPACSLVVRILDAHGESRAGDYHVEASPPREGRRHGDRHAVTASGTYDARTHEHRLAGIPPGRVQIRVHSDLGGWLPETLVDVKAGDPVRVDIVDSAPPDDTRITVEVRGLPTLAFLPTEEHILARRDGGEPRHAHPLNSTSQSFVFEGLTPGEYSLEIDDPRFDRWTKTGVKTGEFVKAQLEGSVALDLSVSDATTRQRVEAYGLRIVYLGGMFARNTFDLRKRGAAAPPNGRFSGIVPGDCELLVEAAGYPEQHVALGELRAHETRSVKIEMQKGLSILGRVVHSDRKTPASGVEVQLTRGAQPGVAGDKGAFYGQGRKRIPSVGFTCTSGADGKFAFAELASGTWSLRAEWSAWLVTDRTIELSPVDSPPIELVEPESGWFEGHVLVPADSVDEGFVVWAKPKAAGATLPATFMYLEGPGLVGADGHFRLGPLPVGEVEAQLIARAPASTSSTSGKDVENSTLSIEAGRTTTHDFDLRATMPGRVRVMAYVDGIAIVRGQAACVRDGWSDERHPWDEPAPFPPDGRAAMICGVDPGRWRLKIDSEDKHWSWALPETFEVKPGSQIDLVAHIELVEREVRCTDTRDGTVFAQHALVALTGLPGHEAQYEFVPDEHGIAKLKLPKGTVTIRDAAASMEAALQWERDGEGRLEARLSPR